MNETNATATVVNVPPAEVERRVAEYRRLAFECQAMPHGLYEEPFVVCPWLGCGFRIAGVDFRLEKGDALDARATLAWWQGAGIVARCPGCRQFVLFSIGTKQRVSDPAATGLPVLPDDWSQRAYVIS
jgi:hypothetical protein